MGFDFVRKEEYFHFNYQTWWNVFTLAVGCGWEPTGTGPPRGMLAENCTGTYFSNDGQRLYARDAKRLADVLQNVVDAPDASSLDFVPARITRWHRRPVGKQGLLAIERFQEIVHIIDGDVLGEASDSAEGEEAWLLTDEGKTCLQEFINFCRGGSFRIH